MRSKADYTPWKYAYDINTIKSAERSAVEE
jgi:hypothetical protein